MRTLDEHRRTIQIIGMIILFIVATTGVLDSRLPTAWRIAHGVLMALAAGTVWRAILRMRKPQ